MGNERFQLPIGITTDKQSQAILAPRPFVPLVVAQSLLEEK